VQQPWSLGWALRSRSPRLYGQRPHTHRPERTRPDRTHTTHGTPRTDRTHRTDRGRTVPTRVHARTNVGLSVSGRRGRAMYGPDSGEAPRGVVGVPQGRSRDVGAAKVGSRPTTPRANLAPAARRPCDHVHLQAREAAHQRC
jgi:hypothetical protein